MSDTGRKQVTRLFEAAAEGDEKALAELTPLVYQELKHLARRHMRAEGPGHTLGTTGLVHEVFLKLVGQSNARYVNRSQFFAIASLTMRRILVNWARAKKQQKRGGDAIKLSLEEAYEPLTEADPEELLALDAALEQLLQVSGRAVKVVECRYFGGLTIEETSEALEISPATVKREWTLAKSWLRRELSR